MSIEKTLSIIKPDATSRNLTGQINSIIEKSVAKAPEHYFWHHRRFKSQAPEIYD